MGLIVRWPWRSTQNHSRKRRKHFGRLICVSCNVAVFSLMLLCFDLHGHRITACDNVWRGWIYMWKSRCKHELPIYEFKKAATCECMWFTSENDPSCVKKTITWRKKKERVIVIIFSTIISISQCPAMMALCESVGVSIWFILNRSSNTSTHFEMHLANAPYNASEWLALFYVITCNHSKDHFSWSMRSFLCVTSCHGCGKKKESFFWCNQ